MTRSLKGGLVSTLVEPALRGDFMAWAFDMGSTRGRYAVDVIMSGGGGGGGAVKAIRVVRLLRLMKLLRVLRGMRIFARWEARLALDYAVLTLQKFFITLLVAAHWLGCTLMVMHEMLAPDCENDADTSTCTFLYAYQDGSMVNTTPLKKYIFAMYFAFALLMGTSFGDVVPVRDEVGLRTLTPAWAVHEVEC